MESLLKKTDHVLAVADFDDIEHLNSLAEKVAGVSHTERRLLSIPRVLDGVAFYPLTVAKSMLYDEMLQELDLPEAYTDLLLIWLLTLEPTSEALNEYSDRKKVLRAIKKLSRSLHCTTDELTNIVQKCMPSVAEEGEGDADYGGVVALLLKEYGGTPEKWLYETSVDTIAELIDQFVAAKASEGQLEPGKAPIPTAKLCALRVFRQAEQTLKEKWRGE